MLGPGVVAIEELTEKTQRQSGRFPQQRLMMRFVQQDPIDAAGENLIDHRLQHGRRKSPGVPACGHGERFSRGQRLAVDMRCRRGLPQISLQRRLAGRGGEGAVPEFRSGNVGARFDCEPIADGSRRVALRFGVVLHAPFVQNLRDHPVMIVGERFFERAVKIPQKALARGRVRDDATDERRNVRHRIVSAPRFELRKQSRRPILHTGFPTIGQQILHAARAQRFLHGVAIDVEVVLEIAAHQDRIEFINLQSRISRLRRAIGLTGQRPT